MRQATKTLVCVCAVTTLLTATAAAQTGGWIRMAWQACPGFPAASAQAAFGCDPASGYVYALHGTYSINAPVTAVALDGIMDFVLDSPDVPPFWQFQAGGCNETGLVLRDAKPTDGSCGTGQDVRIALCGIGGGQCQELITAYVVGSQGGFPANRARLLFTLVRTAASPANLAASPAVHFAFRLEFLMDHAADAAGGGCAGCESRLGATWNQLVVYDSNLGPGAIIDSDDPGSEASVGINCTDCPSVSTANRTWGGLKALYR